MRYILALMIALMIALPLLAMSLEADAGLVENLRSGKSEIKAVSGSLNRLLHPQQYRKIFKSKPDYKALMIRTMPPHQVGGAWGYNSVEAAIRAAKSACERQHGGNCGAVYSLEDKIV